MPWLCERDGHELIAHYAELARRFEAPRLRAPFNLETAVDRLPPQETPHEH